MTIRRALLVPGLMCFWACATGASTSSCMSDASRTATMVDHPVMATSIPFQSQSVQVQVQVQVQEPVQVQVPVHVLVPASSSERTHVLVPARSRTRTRLVSLSSLSESSVQEPVNIQVPVPVNIQVPGAGAVSFPVHESRPRQATLSRSGAQPQPQLQPRAQVHSQVLATLLDTRGGAGTSTDQDSDNNNDNDNDSVDDQEELGIESDVGVDSDSEVEIDGEAGEADNEDGAGTSVVSVAVAVAGDDEDDEDYEKDAEDEEQEDTSKPTTATNTDSESLPLPNSNSEALELRLSGKEAHDSGDFELAAELFQKAADSLQLQLKQQLQQHHPSQTDESPHHIPAPMAPSAPIAPEVEAEASAEEYATCRLHQALCHLKSQKYDQCLQTCSEILDDKTFYTSAVRARAYHRRAKAKLALLDKTGALQDARAAAFLGDRKAVALYGRLMRDTPYSTSDTFGSTSTSTSPSMMDHLFSRHSISNSSSSLLESLMAKSPMDDHPGGNPASLFFGQKDAKSGFDTAGSGLAKSVIKSLAKRLDDDDTLLMISSFLQKTNSAQLNQFASMAGIDVPPIYLDRIESICHRITPKTVKRTVMTTKFAIYVVRIFRRFSRLLQKYKSLLVILAILQWTKSAILRPIPIDRATARRQAKVALKDAMKANRS